jgi:hypothetical protein
MKEPLKPLATVNLPLRERQQFGCIELKKELLQPLATVNLPILLRFGGFGMDHARQR